jgi:Uma2 family endonuclease
VLDGGPQAAGDGFFRWSVASYFQLHHFRRQTRRTAMPVTQAASDYEKERGKPMPSWNHGKIQAAVIIALGRYGDHYDVISELSLELEDLRATPDVCLYPKRPMDLTRDTLRVEEPPHLAVEIVSSTQRTQDLVDKIRDLISAGTGSCWLVQPATRSVTVYGADMQPRTFSEGVVRDETIEGVEVSVAEVFGEA